jgi:arsenite/tail-anchored protein-transporting ATPase
LVRVLLLTGKGGVGKTSIAAGTALRAAAAGHRTLVMSTDPAHSLADALDAELGAEPRNVAPNLDAEQIDARSRLEEHWRQVQSYLVALLAWGGVDEVEAEELSVLPGLEEIFSLIDVRRHAEEGRYDVIVVDCAPTAETLRLLSLPDALGWYLERIFPVQRRVAQVVRPVLGRVTSMPMPADRVLAAVEELHDNLARVRDILSDTATTSVRLVVNPEKLVIAEAQRTFTYLSLFGYAVDAVVVNRLLPDVVADPWFDRWKARQAEHLATVRTSFGDTPILTAPLFDDEPIGAEALLRLAGEVYAERDEAAVLHHAAALTVERRGDEQVLCLPLPLVERDLLDVLRKGDELHVKVGAYQRTLLLPAALGRGEVAGARVVEGRLEVRFADPAGGGAGAVG